MRTMNYVPVTACVDIWLRKCLEFLWFTDALERTGIQVQVSCKGNVYSRTLPKSVMPVGLVLSFEVLFHR
jgi:hypothetical protein